MEEKGERVKCERENFFLPTLKDRSWWTFWPKGSGHQLHH